MQWVSIIRWTVLGCNVVLVSRSSKPYRNLHDFPSLFYSCVQLRQKNKSPELGGINVFLSISKDCWWFHCRGRVETDTAPWDVWQLWCVKSVKSNTCCSHEKIKGQNGIADFFHPSGWNTVNKYVPAYKFTRVIKNISGQRVPLSCFEQCINGQQQDEKTMRRTCLLASVFTDELARLGSLFGCTVVFFGEREKCVLKDQWWNNHEAEYT